MKPVSFYNYKHNHVPLARNLRKNMTLSEVLLWEQIKGKQLFGYKFRRQVAVGNYILDFYCKELYLAIEIDGISHDYKMEYDEERKKWLKEQNIIVLHIHDTDVKKNMHMVVEHIVEEIQKLERLTTPTHPGQPRG